MKIENFNKSNFDLYAAYLKSTGISDASIKRKLSSLANFQKYLIKKGYKSPDSLRSSAPFDERGPSQNTLSSPFVKGESGAAEGDFRLRGFDFKKLFSKSTIYNLRSKPLTIYLLLVSLLIISSAIGYGFYRQSLKEAKSGFAYSTASSPVYANRFLSFQGRLTDSSGNPITSSVSIRFDLFNTEAIGTGTSLYTSATGNSQVVVPDENGIFSVTIGKTHGTEIPNSVFTQNPAVYLQITAGSETMSPRQPIATVAYAINAETLQGLHPSASGTKDTVLVVDSLGNLNLGETSPTIKSTSGTLGIEGQAVLIKATDGSGGNIEINPDANGIIKLTTEGNGSTAVNGFIDATNANLSTGNLYSATIRNTNRGYNFLDFRNYDVGTTQLTTRFSVDAYGNALVGSTLSTTNISIGNTLLTTSAYRLNLFDTIAPTAGSLIYGNGSKLVNTSVGASGQILMSNATGAPVWINANTTGIGTTYTAGNGLTLSSNTFKLGGALTENTNLTIGNTSAFFINSTTGNIGIGTTNPDKKLTISQSDDTSGLKLYSHSAPNSYFNIYLNSGGNPRFESNGAMVFDTVTYGSSGSGIYFRSGGTLQFNDSASKTTIFNAGQLYLTSTGNLGIGTTNPSYKLDVSGTGRFTSNLNVGGTLTIPQGANNGYILQSDASGNASWVSANSTGIGTTYTAGSGLTLSSNTFSLNLGSTNVWTALQTFTNGIGITGETNLLGNLNIGGSENYLKVGDGKIKYNTISGLLEYSNDNGLNYSPFGGAGTLQYGMMESEWVNTGSTLPENLYYSQSTIVGDYIYLFGGANISSAVNSIYRAPVSSPTAWVKTGSTLPGNLFSSQTSIIGDYIYLFGGYSSSATNVIYRAPTSNPTTWVNTGSTLPGNLNWSQSVIIGDYVYLFGGANSSSTTNVIYRAPVSNPTAWTNTGSVLPGNLGYSQAAVIGDYVYLFGGFNGSAATNVIYRAPTSNPTAWVNTGYTIPGVLHYSQLTIIGDYVYLLGGANSSVYVNVIYRAPVSNPTAWTNTGSVLPGILLGSQASIVGDYVYLFGGYTGSPTNVIYRAPIYTSSPNLASNPSWKYKANSGSDGGNLWEIDPITSSNIFYTAGNVGIGTSTPSSKLHVVGSGLFSGSLSVGTNLSIGGTLTLSQGATDGYVLTSDASGNARWAAATGVGSTYFAGNGLNLSGSTFKLGGLLTQNTDIGFSGFSLTFSDGGSTFASFSSAGNTFYNPTTFTSAGDVSMAYDLNFTNSSGSNINTAGPLSINAGEIFGSSNLTLQTYNAGKIILNSSNLYNDGTNFGIGTTAPTYKLDVTGTGRFTSNVNVGGTFTLSQGAQNGYILASDASGNARWILNTGTTYVAGVGLTLSSSNVFSLNLGSTNTWTAVQNLSAGATISTLSTTGNLTIGGTFVSVGSTNLVTNLNADALDGLHASSFLQVGSSANFISTLSNGVGISVVGTGVGRTINVDYDATKLSLTGNKLTLNLGATNVWTALQTFTNGIGVSGTATFTNNLSIGGTFVSVGSTNLVTNLNANYLNGIASNGFLQVGSTGSFITSLSVGGSGLTITGSGVGRTFTNTGLVDITNTTLTRTGSAGTYTIGLNLGSTNTWTSVQNLSAGATISTLSNTGNASIGGTLAVTGRSTFSNNVSVGGTLTLSQGAGNNYLLVSDASGNSRWANPATLGLGTTYAATNGLTLTSGQFGLGGLLTQNTDIGFSGFSLTFSDGGSTFASFSNNGNTFYNPTTFTSAGDVSMAYDLNFTNSSGSNINTAGPLAINSGEVFGSSNLTLQTYNAGKIILNSSNLYNDGTNFGIGTTSPTSALTVAGNGSLTGNLNVGGSLTTTSSSVIGKNLSVGGTFVSVGSTNLVTNLNADVLDGLHASSFLQVGTSGNFISTLSNGVGISVVGTGIGRTINVDYDATKLALTGNKLTLNLGSTNTWTALQNLSAGATISTLSTTGNASIGGTLAVTGRSTFSNNVSVGGTLTLSQGANNNYVLTSDASGNARWAAATGTTYTSGNGITLASTTFKLGGALTENTRLNIGNTEALYIQYSTGNIGIGTTSPDKTLSINGNLGISDGTYSSPAINFNGGGGVFYGSDDRIELLTNGFTALQIFQDQLRTATGSVSAPGISWANRPSTGIFGPTSDEIAFSITGNEAMRINSSGNVGIGTSTPTSKLSIYRAPSNTAGNTSLGFDYNGAGADVWGLRLSSSTYDLNIDREYGGWATTPAMTFQRISGNVGIGTTNPGYKLDVSGDVNITGTYRVNGVPISTGGSTYTAGSGLTLSSTTFKLGGALTENTRLNIGNTEVFYAKYSNGYVGIGTTNPIQKLDVNGKIAINGQQTIYNAQAYGGFAGSLFIGNGGNSLSHTTSSEGYYNIGIGVSSLFNNTTGYGNVAVGDASLYTNNTGSGNVAQGQQALYSNTSGNFNIAQGQQALYANTTGHANIAIGQAALRYLTGDYSVNTAIGSQAGSKYNGTTGNLTSASSSLFLGAFSSALANGGDNEIVIGYNAIGNGTNSATLGNDDITKTILKGNVGIGTTNPTAKLTISESNFDYKIKYIGNQSSDYVKTVILLHEAYDATLLGNNYASGKIFASRGNSASGLRIGVAEINTASAYNRNTGSLISTSGEANKWKLVTVTYNSIKYLAIELPYGAAYYSNGLTFEGYQRSTAANSLTLINYYNVNTSTVLNAEINSSIADFTSYNRIDIDASTYSIYGNVGIGTTNPTSKLHVIGDANITTNLTVGGTFVSVGSTNLVTNLNANYLNGLAYNNLPYVSNTTNSTLTRTGSGPYTLSLNLGSTNVWTALQTFTNGIGVSGTTNLTNNLNVGGTAYFANYVGIGISNPTGPFQVNIGATQAFFIKSNGNVGLGTTNPTYKLTIGGASSTIHNSSGDITIDSASGNVSFSGDNIANINNGYFTSKIGIGTTGPLAPLHIGTTASASVGGQTLTNLSGLFTGSIASPKFYDADNPLYFIDPAVNDVNYNSLGLASQGSIKFNVTDTTGSAKYIGAYAASRIQGFTNGLSLDIGTAASIGVGNTVVWNNNLFLATSGYVGIGTTAPTHKLSVGGASSLISNDSGDITFNAASDNISFAGDNLININNAYFAGNVSIGTTAPIYKFQVHQTTDQNLATFGNFNLSDGIMLQSVNDTASTIKGFEIRGSSVRLTDTTTSGLILTGGYVGIGTTAPTRNLTVIANGSTNGVALFQNTNTGKTVPTMIIQTGSSGTGFTGTFINFVDGSGTRLGRIRNTTAAAVTYGTSIDADFAEYVISDEPTEATDLIAYHGDKFGKAVDGQIVAGTHSNYATFLGNENIADKPNSFPLAMVGIVDVKISSIYGNISPGDPISTSSIPGVAAKATKAGRIVGHAVENYSNNDVNSIGKIKIIVQPTYYDPDISLTATGQINVNYNVSDEVLASLGYSNSKNEIESANYNLTDSLGKTVTKIAQFGQIAAAKIKAGLISTTNLIADNAAIKNLKTNKINTDELISPVGNISHLTSQDIQTTQVTTDNLVAQNIQTTEVTTNNLVAENIESNALTTNDLTASTASVSTLYADNIISKEGSFADIMANKISSLRNELTRVISSEAEKSSTPSAIALESDNWSIAVATDSATISGNLSLTDNLIIGAQLMVKGDAQFGNAFVTGQFTAGEVSIASNYIETSNTALFIQPSNTGSVHIMGETLVIADTGEVKINGNLTVNGSVFANLLEANEIKTQKLTAAEINSDKINIATDSGTILGTVDTNIATDSASMIIADNNNINIATNSAQINSNATAGTATLPAGITELVISTTKLSANSMVYLTPVGSTNNQVLYIKEKFVPVISSEVEKSYFVIGLDQSLDHNIDINWWIIN